MTFNYRLSFFTVFAHTNLQKLVTREKILIIFDRFINQFDCSVTENYSRMSYNRLL